MKPAWRRALMLASALPIAALPWLLERITAPDPGTLLRSAYFGETLDDEKSFARSLPHRWRNDCAHCRTVWYRIDVPLDDTPRDALAVYLPSVRQNAAAYLNGQLLGTGGGFGEPVARLGPRPLLLSVPVPLWAPGDNRLYVLVKSERPYAGFMPAPALGAEVELRAVERLRVLFTMTAPQVAATAAAMLSVVMGVLWFYRRRETEYALFAATMLAWALHALSERVLQPPWQVAPWDAWLMFTQTTAAVLLLLLARRLSVTAPAAMGHLAAGTLLVAGATVSAWEPTGIALDFARALGLLVFVAAGVVLAVAGWRQHDGRLLIPGTALGILACADMLSLLPGFTFDLPALPLGAAFVFGAVGWLLLLRFVQTLKAVELLNVDLETMVQARTTELQSQFERVRDLERRQTIAAERERLMRDMHDGVGGNLVSLLAMIETDRRRPAELVTAVRDALDDMRLMVDSLDPVDDDLNAVLAMWHDRLAPRMRLANVALHWDVELLQPVAGLTPARVLHVLRLLQEAVTNAIRHGHARSLWMSAQETGDGVRISLRDDGVGFDAQSVVSGRGLKNMRRRAIEVDARLDVQSTVGGGTTITLVLTRSRPSAEPLTDPNFR